MVQIIQSGPTQATLRQQAMDEGLNKIIQGYSAYDKQQKDALQTKRQQALDLIKGAADYSEKTGKMITPEDYNSFINEQMKDKGDERPSLVDTVKSGLGNVSNALSDFAKPVREFISGPDQAQQAPTQSLQASVEQKPFSFTEVLKNAPKTPKAIAKEEEAARRAKHEEFIEKMMLEGQTEKVKSRQESTKLKREEIEATKAANQGKAVDDLRREISGLPATKAMTDIDVAYSKIISAPKTPAGDMSRIYGFMKIQDPGSTVREGEYATAQNAGSVPERIRAAYNRVLDGEKLTDIQRADFENSAKKLAISQYNSYSKFIEPHMNNIKGRGLDSSLIVPKFANSGLYSPQSGSMASVPAGRGINANAGVVAHPDTKKNARLEELRAKAQKAAP